MTPDRTLLGQESAIQFPGQFSRGLLRRGAGDDHRQVVALERVVEAVGVDELAGQKPTDTFAPALGGGRKRRLLLTPIGIAHLDHEAVEERGQLPL
jgi:hypothetical protein